MIYAGVLVGMYTLHLMLKMHWITTGIVTVYMLLRVREHRRLYRQSNEQKLRFGEVTDYLDTVLYAFLKEGKVETALEDTQAALVDGPMREAVVDALDHMHMTFDESNVMTDALHFIEKQYPCHRVKAVHDFLCMWKITEEMQRSRWNCSWRIRINGRNAFSWNRSRGERCLRILSCRLRHHLSYAALSFIFRL